jgi:hypothetical protein
MSDENQSATEIAREAVDLLRQGDSVDESTVEAYVDWVGDPTSRRTDCFDALRYAEAEDAEAEGPASEGPGTLRALDAIRGELISIYEKTNRELEKRYSIIDSDPDLTDSGKQRRRAEAREEFAKQTEQQATEIATRFERIAAGYRSAQLATLTTKRQESEAALADRVAMTQMFLSATAGLEADKFANAVIDQVKSDSSWGPELVTAAAWRLRDPLHFARIRQAVRATTRDRTFERLIGNEKTRYAGGRLALLKQREAEFNRARSFARTNPDAADLLRGGGAK